VLRAVLVGLAVGAATVCFVFSMVAIPYVVVARLDPGHGLDRTAIRGGLFHVALPIGLVVGLLGGLAVGRWYRRGGRIPDE
jgi:hypothetical protein